MNTNEIYKSGLQTEIARSSYKLKKRAEKINGSFSMSSSDSVDNLGDAFLIIEEGLKENFEELFDLIKEYQDLKEKMAKETK